MEFPFVLMFFSPIFSVEELEYRGDPRLAPLNIYYVGDQIKRMRWEENVACMGRREMHTGFWWGNLKKKSA